MNNNERLPKNIRYPLEMPIYIICIFVNIAAMIGLAYIAFVPETPGTPLGDLDRFAVRAVAAALLTAVPGLIIWRQVLRAQVRASAVRMSETQFPAIYETVRRHAARLEMKQVPEIYVVSGNGSLNAFAASTLHFDYTTVHAELFMNTLDLNREALDFIIGHELGHIKLSHTRLLYQISIAYLQYVPLVGQFLSRLREYSCDRVAAWLEPDGDEGLVLLAAGRHVYKQVNIPELLQQSGELKGLFHIAAMLQRSHPFTVNRLLALYDAGLFKTYEQFIPQTRRGY